MFKHHTRFSKFSSYAALAAFSLSTLKANPASAYNSVTHSRIAQVAMRATQPSCFEASSGCTRPILIAPKGEEAAFAAYLKAVSAVPGKFALLKTGLPTSTAKGGTSVIPGDSDDTTAYPFSSQSPPTCPLLPGEARDLNQLGSFRIMDLGYYPTSGEACGLATPDIDPGLAQGAVPTDPAAVTARATELVLGWHAESVDKLLDDTALWVRPANVGTWGVTLEAASWVWEAAVGTVLLPFALLYDLFAGKKVHIDDTYALARQYNPVDEIQGAIPGIGDIRSDTFTGLWHYESVDAGIHRFNDTRGMWYPGAGPSSPGAVDLGIMAITQASGLSLNTLIATGPKNYGAFDKIHRTWPQWQAHTVGTIEWSPLHNLAAHGWAKFKADPSSAAGLAWPLHAIGDACEPHHVTSTTAWGHRTFEDWVSKNMTNYFPQVYSDRGFEVPTEQNVMERRFNDMLFAGFRWWKQFHATEDMAALIHDLAVETRAEIKAEGDWPFSDWYSTRYAGGQAEDVIASNSIQDDATNDYGKNVVAGHDDDVRKLINNAVGAAIAVYAVAATKISPNATTAPNCPAGQTYVLEQRSVHVQNQNGTSYDQPYTAPGCSTVKQSTPPPTPLGSQGIAQIASAVCETGICGKPDGQSCALPAECQNNSCYDFVCGKPNGASCTGFAECATGSCWQGKCGRPNGSNCSSAAECALGQCNDSMCGKAQGVTCTKADQCASGLCESGACGKAAGDPCQNKQECSLHVCSSERCGKANGSSCASASECAATVCSGGICGKPNGSACTDWHQCAASVCTNGACGTPSGSACSSSATCTVGQCVNSLCCIPQHQACSNSSDCCAPTFCAAGFCRPIQ